MTTAARAARTIPPVQATSRTDAAPHLAGRPNLGSIAERPGLGPMDTCPCTPADIQVGAGVSLSERFQRRRGRGLCHPLGLMVAMSW